MGSVLDGISKSQRKDSIPDFRIGDTVKVHVKIVEEIAAKKGKMGQKKEKAERKERVQVFQGIVIRRKGGGISETFTVRKVSYGEGVERIFPLHSPNITKIEVVRQGAVRRAKLYYLRERVGKAAKVKEKKKQTKAKAEPQMTNEIQNPNDKKD
ncbi:50S ribosomal protein L19 [bacterium]|nr:50S ribosomal protein L19 [bacterium]